MCTRILLLPCTLSRVEHLLCAYPITWLHPHRPLRSTFPPFDRSRNQAPRSWASCLGSHSYMWTENLGCACLCKGKGSCKKKEAELLFPQVDMTCRGRTLTHQLQALESELMAKPGSRGGWPHRSRLEQTLLMDVKMNRAQGSEDPSLLRCLPTSSSMGPGKDAPSSLAHPRLTGAFPLLTLLCLGRSENQILSWARKTGKVALPRGLTHICCSV